jgi:all-trans-retinol dehydrogenase (NAD+)
MKNLKEKVALVTGAAMGMGRGLAEQFLLEGCTVALVDVNKQALEQTANDLSKLGKCSRYVCDISDREAVYALAKQVEKDLGFVAILVNNAGIVKAKGLLDLDDDAIEKTLNINLTSMFWTCKAFLPAMVKHRERHVVNFASAGGILAIPNLSAYCASKFGVIGFTDAVRQEMRPLKANIGFTVVCPNTVNTGMFAGSKMVAGTRMLTTDEVTHKVLEAIKKNQAMVAVPSMPVKFMTPLTKLLLPIKVMDWMNDVLGMAHANDTWT